MAGGVICGVSGVGCGVLCLPVIGRGKARSGEEKMGEQGVRED